MFDKLNSGQRVNALQRSMWGLCIKGAANLSNWTITIWNMLHMKAIDCIAHCKITYGRRGEGRRRFARETLVIRQNQKKNPFSPSEVERGEGGGGEAGRASLRLRTEPYIDELGVVTLLQVVKDRSIVEIGQIGHVFGFLILGRVHLLQLVLLEILGLSSRPRERKERNGVSGEESKVIDLRRSIWRSNAASNCATPTPRSGKSNRPCLRISRISAGSLGTAGPCGTVSSARALRNSFLDFFFLFFLVVSIKSF